MDLERFKEWLPMVVDALPPEEAEVLTGLFWEQASLRTIAQRLGWRLSGGGWDGKKVERVRDQALERIAGLAKRLEVEVALDG